MSIFLIDIEAVVLCVLIGNELPTFKIHVAYKVIPPCRFHCRFESKDKNALKAHSLGQLITCKGFTETHLCIPKEFRSAVGFINLLLPEIVYSHLNRTLLLRTHVKCLGAFLDIGGTGLESHNSGHHILCCTLKPFVLVLTSIELKTALLFKECMNIVVSEARTIITHCRFPKNNFIRNTHLTALFLYSGLNITISVSYLEIAFM